MRYRSTGRKAALTSLRGAVLRGLAPDGGLYMPVEIARRSPQELEEFRKLPFTEVCFRVVRPFATPDVPEEVLWQIVKVAGCDLSKKWQAQPSDQRRRSRGGATPEVGPTIAAWPSTPVETGSPASASNIGAAFRRRRRTHPRRGMLVTPSVPAAAPLWRLR